MTNLQINSKVKSQRSKLFAHLFTSLLAGIVCLFSYSTSVAAQTVTLSVSPPLLEVMIAPGKSISYDFVISSPDSSVVVAPRLTGFVPTGPNGETEVNSVPPPSFVTFDPQPISLSPGQSVPLTLKISPPADQIERDFYLRLIFETQDTPALGGANGSVAKVQIAANILLTVSKNGLPQKLAQIVSFSAPSITDSFMPISYNFEVQNIGRTYFKPIGKITVTQFGNDISLNLAPQNVLAGSSRNISCLDGENLVACKLPGLFHLGVYKAAVEFNLDDSAEVYSARTNTIALPFSPILIIIAVWLISRSVKILVDESKRLRFRR